MNYKLDILNRLGDINEDKDIKALSHAIFPGTHCPLFGVALTASYVEDMYILVVGTSECTYYTKNFSNNRQRGNDRVYSLVLKDKDIIFGAYEKVKEGVLEIYKRENPKAIMIVTTCVPELIGEDYEGVVLELEGEIDAKIMVVNTEHYKCSSHIPGMTRAMASFIKIMDDNCSGEGVNILGHRYEGAENTELIKLLKGEGIEINSIIPSLCNVDNLKDATKVKLNIVMDMTALELAKKMESKFNIPFVFFDKHMDKTYIRNSYSKIEDILDISIKEELDRLEGEYNYYLDKTKEILVDKKFVYGNTPMQAFETSDFLVSLGAIPELIQVRELYDVDKIWKDKIFEKGYNPYITRIANIAPLRELYDVMEADIYIGHENPMLLKEKGITQITFDECASKLGYELPISIMKKLLKTFKKED